ncbi:MAG: DUF805 domain-containing protein [Ruminiclostridium sp.]|nr:DUF805 domain-containing protein [Ruminiclostridium sp.]
MIYCSKCGTSAPEGQFFCENCGEPLAQASRGGSYGCGLNVPVRKVTFGEAVKNFFTNYANFSGRATRSEFWYAWLFNLVANMAFGVLAEMGLGIFAAVYPIAVLIPSLAIAWRRFHDIGKSGAWWFILFLPLVGWIFYLVWMCTDSKEDNQYGPRKTEANRDMIP